MKNKILTLLILLMILNINISFGQVGPKKPEKGGCVPCLVGIIFGPRTGYLYNEGVSIRTLEIFSAIGFFIHWTVGILFAIPQLIDIYNGRTWTEVEIDENLRDPAFKEWHRYQVERSSI
ncbi:MAG: hypothetical protein ABIL05_04685 [candidate division WOR-3 bacterium]